jgi:hypothetical protein
MLKDILKKAVDRVPTRPVVKDEIVSDFKEKIELVIYRDGKPVSIGEPKKC